MNESEGSLLLFMFVSMGAVLLGYTKVTQPQGNIH